MTWVTKIAFFIGINLTLLWGQTGVKASEQDFFAYANELYDQGKYMEAVRFYRAAIANEQYEVFAWFNLGNSLVHIERHHLALVAYRRSIELAPDFSRPWVLIGDLYFIHQDIGLALAAYKRAVDLGEDSEHLHYAMGECYRLGGDYASAQRHFEQLLLLNPDRVEVWFALAEMRENLEDYQSAIELLDQAIQISPAIGADLYFYLAYLHLAQDSTRAAMVALEDGLVLKPQHNTARRHLSQLYEDAEMPWMAIFTLEQGLQSNATDRELLVDLGRIFLEQNRYDEALDYFVKAWQQGSVQGRIGAENVGNALYNHGDTLAAEQAWQRVRQRR
ncbi:MAG: tetratricopeptide repeat protein [Fibrobacter sp.]|nr:tetratricopeptide repeat protein [Fibrobacter sp.]